MLIIAWETKGLIFTLEKCSKKSSCNPEMSGLTHINTERVKTERTPLQGGFMSFFYNLPPMSDLTINMHLIL